MTDHRVDTNGRGRRGALALATLLVMTALTVIGPTAASAHEGHLATETTKTGEAKAVGEDDGEKDGKPTRGTTTALSAALITVDELHLDRAGQTRVPVRRTGTGQQFVAVGGQQFVAVGGQINGVDADCFIDFDDDLTLQYHIPGGAENTFMTGHWFQKCFDDSYPAVAVKFMDYGHLHLGYEDSRIGPCSGSFEDWGRKADPAPSDPDDIGQWASEPCVSEIDPITEPRSGISPHVPGHRAQILAYDGDGYLPFQLSSLQVVRGEIEVCHLPPGPIVVANGGGSPWQCDTFGQGYWNLANHVPSAIEARIEFLTNGQVDNIAIDLL